MKNRLIALFSLFLGVMFNAQIEVEYEVTSLSDSTNANSAKAQKMVLQYIDGKSFYFSKEKWLGQQKIKKDIEAGGGINLLANSKAYGRGLSNEKVEKDFSANMLNFYDTILTDNFSYSESIPKIEWQITNEKTEMLGHPMGIAKGNFRGRNYTAWFAEDIAIADGPYKFSGLPGLILKIEDDNKNYSFSAISIAKLEKIDNVNDGKKWTKTTRQKYQDIKRNSVVNAMQYISQISQSQGVTFTPVNGSQNKVADRPYNPIELK